MKTTLTRLFAAVLTFALVGCETLSSVLPDHGRDYKRSRVERSLEVPPGLTTESIQDAMPVPGLERTEGISYSSYSREPSAARREPLASGAGAEGPPQTRLTRDRDANLTLLIGADFDRSWNLTGKALLNRGIQIDDEDRQRGIYRIRYADPVSDGPDKEGLLDSLKFWGDPNAPRAASVPQDRFFQLAMKTTQGVTSLVVFDEDDQRDRSDAAARVLTRLKRGIAVVSQPVVGGSSDGPIADVVRDGSGRVELLVNEGMSAAWDRTARALNQAGIKITEASRQRGIYSVRYEGPAAREDEGLLERINIFADDDQSNYLIAMKGSGGESVAVVFDTDGTRVDSPVAVEMLGLLEGAMLGERERERRLAGAGPQGPRARIEQDADGLSRLVVVEPFPQAWRLTGLALDQAGFAVKDRNRSRGVYAVRYRGDLGADEKESGFFSRMFGGDGDGDGNGAKPSGEYQIALRDEGPETLVVVFDDQGNRDGSEVATRILNILAERIN